MSDEHDHDEYAANSIIIQAGQVIRPYTNHRGERATRRLITRRLYFGTSEYHPGEQWLLEAWDCEKHAIRTFALNNFLDPPRSVFTADDVDLLKGAVASYMDEAYGKPEGIARETARCDVLAAKLDVMFPEPKEAKPCTS